MILTVVSKICKTFNFARLLLQYMNYSTHVILDIIVSRSLSVYTVNIINKFRSRAHRRRTSLEVSRQILAHGRIIFKI